MSARLATRLARLEEQRARQVADPRAEERRGFWTPRTVAFRIFTIAMCHYTTCGHGHHLGNLQELQGWWGCDAATAKRWAEELHQFYHAASAMYLDHGPTALAAALAEQGLPPEWVEVVVEACRCTVVPGGYLPGTHRFVRREDFIGHEDAARWGVR